MPETDDKKVHAALTRAVQQLESAVREQEQAVDRILGLIEEVRPRLDDRHAQFQMDAIMEACAFQDVTGQRIRKVAKLVAYLRDHKKVKATELPSVAKPDDPPSSPGLSQADIDRLLAGGKPVTERSG